MPGKIYATELFYEDCKDTNCVKAYISQKSKISEGQYRVTTMYLNYKNRGSNTADEETRTAKVNCDKNTAAVTWGSNKPQKIDKSIFPKATSDKKVKQLPQRHLRNMMSQQAYGKQSALLNKSDNQNN